MTGDLTPDSTGDFLPHIVHNGKMSYVRGDSAYFIWWQPPATWVISQALDWVIFNIWTRADPDIQGDYVPLLGAAGDATVTEI